MLREYAETLRRYDGTSGFSSQQTQSTRPVPMEVDQTGAVSGFPSGKGCDGKGKAKGQGKSKDGKGRGKGKKVEKVEKGKEQKPTVKNDHFQGHCQKWWTQACPLQETRRSWGCEGRRPPGPAPEVGAKMAKALRAMSCSTAGTPPGPTSRSMSMAATGPGCRRLSSSMTSDDRTTRGSQVSAIQARRRAPSEMRGCTLAAVRSASSNWDSCDVSCPLGGSRLEVRLGGSQSSRRTPFNQY